MNILPVGFPMTSTDHNCELMPEFALTSNNYDGLNEALNARWATLQTELEERYLVSYTRPGSLHFGDK